MRTLNAGAMRAALANGVRAATDMTGFGLLGHLGNMLDASAVGARIDFAALPILEGVGDLAAQGVVPGGTARNYEAAAHVQWGEQLSQGDRHIVVDAQTSGGLLLAVPPKHLDGLLESLRKAGSLARAVIGTLTDDRGLSVS